MKKNLLDVIRFYEDNDDVKVEVYFKNGLMKELHDMKIEKDHFIMENEKKVSYEQLSHAEIFAA